MPQAAQQYRSALIRTAHAVWGMDAPVAVFAARVHQESSWRSDAVSHVGAAGLAQFMPKTAEWISGTDQQLAANQPFNPAWALRALVTYDKQLYSVCPQPIRTARPHVVALRSYNGGLGHWQKEAAISGVAQPSRASGCRLRQGSPCGRPLRRKPRLSAPHLECAENGCDR